MNFENAASSSRHWANGRQGFSNFVDVLRLRADIQPNNAAYVFLKDGEQEQGVLTYFQLDQRARSIAVEILKYAKQGDRVALAYPPGLDFILAFFGCLYAGVVAVPVYPPNREAEWERFHNIAHSAHIHVVLATHASMVSMRASSPESGVRDLLRYIITDEICSTQASSWCYPDIDPDTLAFLQFTSGSTGTPKGVMVTHKNLLHNQRLIAEAFQHTANSVVVGWLPLYHDMGLIGNVLQPLYLGTKCILMAPAAFILNPVKWLEAITKYQANTSGGPNFAYDLCVRRITDAEMRSLDLSSWKVAFNGAEKIKADTLQRFAQKFSSCGFQKSAFLCCYGMAETTLFVSGKKRVAEPVTLAVEYQALKQNQIRPCRDAAVDAMEIVGCGSAIDLDLIIVDPETETEAAPDRVGEIWVKGESVASGYWGLPEATTQTFHSYTKDTQRGPYLRTGDLGFLRQNELFVTGRQKELIIVRGRNYYPQDIEAVAQVAHPSLAGHGGAAFAIDTGGEESLVLAHEVSRSAVRTLNYDEIAAQVRFALASQAGLPLFDLILLKPGQLLKTSSGKVRRAACRDAYLAGSLISLGKVMPQLPAPPSRA